jgi:hypothetical protein
VLVGAKEYTIGASHQGVAFLYNGGSGGLNPSGFAITVNKADSDFGFCVAGAGDVNRDGYADFVVGAPTSSASGSISIYLGGMNGPSAPTTINGFFPNYTTLLYGSSVSSAGDVNGDGYGDIMVGARASNFGQQGEGTVLIYHGSSSGIEPIYKTLLQGDQIDADFGVSVAPAGDVNGDGYSDVIVGSRYQDHGHSNEGVAIIYYGTSNGVSTAAPATPTLLEIDVTNAYFGSSVSGAGDVNGDGYSDVIVGAPYYSNGQNHEGKAFVFHGSPTGVKTTSSFSVEGEQIGVYLGGSVSGAGDVNGDGYSDVLVGIPYYDNGQYAIAGAMNVLYGNNGKGLRNNVRLYNSGLVGPYDHNQFNLQNFGLGLFVKSFIGRNRARLVWETRSNGNAFSKVDPNPITTSTQFSGEGSNLPLLMEGVERTTILNKAGTTTRVRARIRYSPVLAITGQMYGPWRYVQRQLAGYNNAPVPEEAMAETIRKKAEPEADALATLFPNPASDRLSIQVADPSDIRAVRLYNASGKPVFQSQRYEKDIDVSKLPGGIYILMLNRANGTPTSHRILIRR